MFGDRLKIARKRAGLSLRDLSAKLGSIVSAQAIGKYERGEMAPSSAILLGLSKALDVSIPYLMSPLESKLSKVEFRAKSTTTEKDRAKVETVVLEWVDRYLEIERILELDSASWKAPFEPRQISALDEAEALANEVRSRWSLGWDPIANIIELFEDNGLKVLLDELPEKVSGLTCIATQPSKVDVPVIVVNQKSTLERRRLTLAHELAHRLISDSDSMTQKFEEQAATRFASAFLMPKDHVLMRVGKHRFSIGYSEIVYFKKLYKVSAAAFACRLKELEVITPEALTYIFQSMGRSWRRTEPEPLQNDETPARFRALCFRALSEGLISKSKAAELLRENIESVERELRGPQ